MSPVHVSVCASEEIGALKVPVKVITPKIMGDGLSPTAALPAQRGQKRGCHSGTRRALPRRRGQGASVGGRGGHAAPSPADGGQGASVGGGGVGKGGRAAAAQRSSFSRLVELT